MASTLATTVLDNNVTLTASAGDNTSSVWTKNTGYGGTLFLKNTNGATGPTVAAQSQVWGSPDNSNWYKIGGAIAWTLGNGVISSLSIPIPASTGYVKVVSGSNTGQNTTFRSEGTQVTAIS
jgi:hypothetical protein